MVLVSMVHKTIGGVSILDAMPCTFPPNAFQAAVDDMVRHDIVRSVLDVAILSQVLVVTLSYSLMKLTQ